MCTNIMFKDVVYAIRDCAFASRSRAYLCQCQSLRVLPIQSASADSTSRAMEVSVAVFEMNMREDYVRRIRDRRSVLYDDIVYSK